MGRVSKGTRFALPLLLVGAVAVACNDNKTTPTGPTIADLAGTWNATSVVLTWDANPSIKVDPVQAFGATITLEITTAGRFTFTIDVPGQPLDVTTGDFTLNGTNFTLTNDADPTDVLSGSFTLSGNNLSITVQHAELLDFDGDGVEDPALLEAQFTRA